MRIIAMEVYLAEGAFLGILLATVETYNRECMGLLIGVHRNNGDVAVQHALDDLFLKLAVWHLDGERDQPRLATLRCPFALDFRG